MIADVIIMLAMFLSVTYVVWGDVIYERITTRPRRREIPKFYTQRQLQDHAAALAAAGKRVPCTPAGIIADLEKREAAIEEGRVWRELDDVLHGASHAAVLELLPPDIAKQFTEWELRWRDEAGVVDRVMREWPATLTPRDDGVEVVTFEGDIVRRY